MKLHHLAFFVCYISKINGRYEGSESTKSESKQGIYKWKISIAFVCSS